MSMRLIKACKDLNIRMKDAIEFLHSKGFEINYDPNYMLQDDLVYLIQKEFHRTKFDTDKNSNNLTKLVVKNEHLKNEKTYDLANDKKQPFLKQKNKKRETGVVSKTHDLYGFIQYNKEEIFFHQSSVKNKILLEVGDKVTFEVNQSQKKAGKFVAAEIEIINKYSPDSIQIFPTRNVKYNNRIFNFPNTLFENVKLINGIFNSNFEEFLIVLEQIIKNTDLDEAILLTNILKLENSIKYSEQKLNSNINFWLLWFSDLESNKFIKSLIGLSDEDIIKKFMIAQLKDKNFNVKVNKLYTSLPPSIILKLWLNDIYGKFDYKLFSNYYFTLNSSERKVFNKRAKAFMKEEITASIYKQKEPWKLISTFNCEKGDLVRIYSATWKSVWFRDGYILICIEKEPKFSEPYFWDFSEEKMNLLNEYISGRKLTELKITVIEDKINNIEGLDCLEEVIWKLEIQREINTGNDGKNILHKTSNLKIPTNMLIKNSCIQFLNKLQIKELEPTRIIEKNYNLKNGSITIDVSLLYSIPINNFEIAIIWESLELEKSKRTHVFKCNSDEYNIIFNDIENNLVNQIKVRRKLNSCDFEDVNYQKKLKYLSGINHDNFDYKKWESDLFELLPELKLNNI